MIIAHVMRTYFAPRVATSISFLRNILRFFPAESPSTQPISTNAFPPKEPLRLPPYLLRVTPIVRDASFSLRDPLFGILGFLVLTFLSIRFAVPELHDPVDRPI